MILKFKSRLVSVFIFQIVVENTDQFAQSNGTQQKGEEETHPAD